MEYIPPLNGDISDSNRAYIDAKPSHGIEGSIPTAKAIEYPMREIVAVIEGAGITPSNEDIHQLEKAIEKRIQNGFPAEGTAGQVLTKTQDGMAWNTPDLTFLEEYRISRIGNVEFGDIALLTSSFVPADGRLVHFVNYPELHKKIQENRLPIIDFDSEGVTRAEHIGAYMYNENKDGVYIPSMGGYFLRCTLVQQEIDAGRKVGTKQLDQLQAHQHGTGIAMAGSDSDNNTPACGNGDWRWRTWNSSSYVTDSGFLAAGTPRIGNETRPTNIAQHPIIYLGKVQQS